MHRATAGRKSALLKVTLHSQKHEWHERTADGRRRYVRAEWNSRHWTFHETFKESPEWLQVASPALGDFEALRGVLERKYRRNRVPWRFIEHLDALLEEMRVAPNE